MNTKVRRIHVAVGKQGNGECVGEITQNSLQMKISLKKTGYSVCNLKSKKNVNAILNY